MVKKKIWNKWILASLSPGLLIASAEPGNHQNIPKGVSGVRFTLCRLKRSDVTVLSVCCCLAGGEKVLSASGWTIKCRVRTGGRPHWRKNTLKAGL